ncbi:voltage-gated sodium channel [Tepidamorphus gemmatus]|uniref:Voltage-gated sodium channel n=1 Tax=Tepidamorphus gemmatus TaxID=747076 RepID=A0A4R3LT28_9HYPH|nr:ion transporter [Tepidamorphus gemmatus]TCT03692.1 voltage-gated sodium channel [Tepidamorphus gemmatus]
MALPDLSSLRHRVGTLVESDRFQHAIVAVIVLNAIVLGLETSQVAMAVAGPLLVTVDLMCLTVFVVEIALKLYAFRFGFFRSGWNIFDFSVVAIALVPATEGFAVLRALRILRVMRLISMVPTMRKVVQALVGAIPPMGTVIALLGLVFYVFAVMATKLFGQSFPDWFGTVGASLYSLFQIMTLESWSMGIVRPVMEAYPYAWVFFVPFILVTTFAVMNLFVAIIVNSMQSAHEDEARAAERQRHDDLVALSEEVRALRREIRLLTREVDALSQGEEARQR